jgi:hypothetical protein
MPAQASLAGIEEVVAQEQAPLLWGSSGQVMRI